MTTDEKITVGLIIASVFFVIGLGIARYYAFNRDVRCVFVECRIQK